MGRGDVRVAQDGESTAAKVSSAGREQYGAWREGTHDDLVFAVALACWGARKIYPGGASGWWSGGKGRVV